MALRHFVEVGYAGTSLQMIADAAGYSKSSVLYHFPSKEALLEACLAPAVAQLGDLLEHTVDRASSPERRTEFVEEFVDFLLAHRLEAHILINQGQTLVEVPVIQNALAYVERLAQTFMSTLPTTEQRLRLGMALGGAAFVLVIDPTNPPVGPSLDDPAFVAEVRSALVSIITQLIEPLDHN